MRSFFDYDNFTIGPYNVRIPIRHIYTENTNKIAEYRFYEAMLRDPQALAVFNINNACLCVVTRTEAYQVSIHPYDPKEELYQWYLNPAIQTPYYEHIGYVKSYPACIAVTQLPTFLLRECHTNVVYGYNQPLEGIPQVNPPLQLYKELITTEFDAVYFDTVSNSAKFLNK